MTFKSFFASTRYGCYQLVYDRSSEYTTRTEDGVVQSFRKNIIVTELCDFWMFRLLETCVIVA